MRMAVPWTGSPGSLKSIYSINLMNLAKLEIFCLTLCRTWYNIGRFPNSMPHGGKPADLRTGSRTVHGATIAPKWPTRHWIDPNIRVSSSDFVHPSGPIGPGAGRCAIVTTRPTGRPWSRKLAAKCNEVPFRPARPAGTCRLGSADTCVFAQISSNRRCAALLAVAFPGFTFPWVGLLRAEGDDDELRPTVSSMRDDSSSRPLIA